MRNLNSIVPALAAFMAVGGSAFAQPGGPSPSAEQPVPAEASPAPEAAPAAETTTPENGAQEGKAETESEVAEAGGAQEGGEAERADAAKKKVANIPPRTPEQAAAARKIAQSAPKRQWPAPPPNPERDGTVMYESGAKKVSDVAIIAAVDQKNTLELLDITGESTSDNLSMPTASFTSTQGPAPQGAAGASPEGEAPAEASAEQADPAPSPTLDSLSETSPQE